MARTVEILIKADDQATKTLRGVGAGLGQLGGFAGKALVGGIALAAGALVGVGATALKVGDQFDQALNVIRAGTGATGSELDVLGESFRAVFRRVPENMDVAVGAFEAMTDVGGATQKQIQDLSVQILDASRVLGENATPNAEEYVRALNQFEVGAGDAGVQLDFLFGLTQKYNVGLSQIIGMTTEYGSVLKNAGFNMAESADLMARVTAAGISWSRVSPGLNAAMRKWATSGQDVKVMLGESVDAIKAAKTETQALAIATEVFGAEGAQRLAVAIRTGAFALDDLGTGLSNASGLIKDTAGDTLRLSERFSLLKNKVFDAMIPMGQFAFDIIESAMPRVEMFVDRVTGLGAAFFDFARSGDIGGLRTTLIEMFGPEASAAILSFVSAIQNNLPQIKATFAEVFGTIKEVIGTVISFISENFETFKAVLIAIGAVLVGAMVLGAIMKVAGVLTMLLNPIVWIIAAVALLAIAWQRDWGGIRTFITEFWNNSIKPVLTELQAWFAVNIPKAMGILTSFWNETLKPVFEEIWQWLGTTISSVLLRLSLVWTGVLLPAITSVWEFIKGSLIPLFGALVNVWFAILGLGLRLLAGIWENVLKPAIRGVWSFVQDHLIPIFNTLITFISNTLSPIVSGIAGKFDSVGSSIGGISGAVQGAINWLNNLAGAIGGIHLPSWLSPGSPTPFELGLRGIANEMRQLSTAELPMFQARLGALGGTVSNNYNLTINSSASTEPIVADFNMMRSLAGA